MWKGCADKLFIDVTGVFVARDDMFLMYCFELRMLLKFVPFLGEKFFYCGSADVVCSFKEDSVWLTGAYWYVLLCFVEHFIDCRGWVAAISEMCFEVF